ncbi:Uncharacterized protein LOK49_LG08G03075 [Camellia lanceoleosa]|uniref:Uncharacterized protein n=1 Tax=Camellia lanceoleosa TaxID=1840588 RepID=A0ACC0GUU9_9ERIC|nr:Uncharacterized protein LOK49_LG08G03075 [Camellia lanceoleosa]
MAASSHPLPSSPPCPGADGLSLEEGSGESDDTSTWRTRGELTISPWQDNVYLFQFSEEDDRHRVLRDSPWSVMGWLLNVQPLSPSQTAEELDFSWCQFWVQVHGLPIQKLTKQNGAILGHKIGRLVRVEAHTEGLLFYRSFLRIRVATDTHQPLPRGLWLQRGLGIDDLWLTFNYEKLSNFCYDCGRLGHESNSCKFVSKEEDALSHYGPELRTTIAGPTGLSNEFYRRRVDDLEATLAPIFTGRNQPSERAPTVLPPRTDTCTTPTQPLNPTPLAEPCRGQRSYPTTLPRVVSPPAPSSADVGSKNTPLQLLAQVSPFPSPTPQVDSGPLSHLRPKTSPDPNTDPFDGAFGAPSRPSYFVTEPPDSPNYRGALDTFISNHLQVPPQPTLHDPSLTHPSVTSGPALEGCLSQALQHLTLKRKDLATVDLDFHRNKLQRVDGDFPQLLLEAPTQLPHVLGVNSDGHKSTPAARQRGRRGRPHRKRTTPVRGLSLVDVVIQNAETELETPIPSQVCFTPVVTEIEDCVSQVPSSYPENALAALISADVPPDLR